MWELVVAGGWVMLPLLLCSIGALAIGLERAWALRVSLVLPARIDQRLDSLAARPLSAGELKSLHEDSPLGRILAAGLAVRGDDPRVIRERIEEAGREVVHELERYLNTLGTIAAVAPLLGLLGTVIGMIKVFAAITAAGVGDAQPLAGGISEALLTTAAGLCVAIPALVLYRTLRGRVDDLVMRMETRAIRLADRLGAPAPA
ncbi:MotA/TolQ/ExbB proton channel family protein [Spectribacter hydrogenoxidans]|uniref:MotA/TolQ/ExbB proton channel family protein n=1 Tax=Spectribacter hydrogenoxidans TaxID=3075608 RepID=A0ABU3C2W4_9GAMM|nr:MotA/TolQ/ExbB proton channel family protein [Salinisphaera sp. W335]MDT0635890.1 MotA/TolQ/ExbB proton channel family protein [Salinisphaera sp. W335]